MKIIAHSLPFNRGSLILNTS